ncbi:unnamed protein product [Diamesa hyperborea]
MMIIKWILLIAFFKYSHGKALEKSTNIPELETKGLTRNTNDSCGVDLKCTHFLYCNDSPEISQSLVVEYPCYHSYDVCCSNITKTIPKNILVNHEVPTKCGVLNPNGIETKIKETIDGEAAFGEFPWMVMVLEKQFIFNDISNVYICGGSLIHPSIVLTAAFKVLNETKKVLSVRAGEYDTHTSREPLEFVESNVAYIVKHEKYQEVSGTYNIALLFLETPFERNLHINTICLPPPNFNFDDSRCFVTGWGKDKFGEEGRFQDILKKIEVPVVGRQRCTKMFQNAQWGRTFELNESLICAGGEIGRDACKGDEGSPLVCPVPGNEGHYYQAGIVAWGIGCGQVNVPTAYTDVAFFFDWISKQMESFDYDVNIFNNTEMIDLKDDIIYTH